MSKQAMNLIVILSDQHNKRITGCYGDALAQTPNLDRLAEEGVVFDNAYTPCPICMPARACMATGVYAHQGRFWDNAHAYDGQLPSFGKQLTDAGVEVTTIGKLHFKDDSPQTGFPHQIIPLHSKNGIGEPAQCLRNGGIIKPQQKKGILNAGPGMTDYIRYDREVTRHVEEFLKLKGQSRNDNQPWLLHVGFVNPHPPHQAPPEYFDRYRDTPIPPPNQYSREERPMHPVLEGIRRFNDLQDAFDSEAVLKMQRTYYAKVSYLDAQIGRILQSLEDSGLADNTRILYSSDHGENLGNHGLWFKQTMYEESAGVPMIMAGPDIPKGGRRKTIVNLTDVFGAVLSHFNAGSPPDDLLWEVGRGHEIPGRTAFSEFHCCGAYEDIYMIRSERYKYVYYHHHAPQLFDMELDPNELNDLANEPSYRDVIKTHHQLLTGILDPDDVDRECRSDQEKVLNRFGGREHFDENAFWKGIGSPVPAEFLDRE